MQSTTRKALSLIVALAAVAILASGAQAAPQSTWDNGFHTSRNCESCHVPHAATSDNSQVPLWNPAHSTTTITEGYSGSESMNATVGAPDGASRLCLSCHDGTYAHVHAEHSLGTANDMAGLANNHPVSFVYDAALIALDDELVDPSTLADDVLDGQEKMQCTSCHDIHSTAPFGKSHKIQDTDANGDPVDTDGDGDDTNDLNTDSHDGHYLRWAYNETYAKGDFCRTCHLK